MRFMNNSNPKNNNLERILSIIQPIDTVSIRIGLNQKQGQRPAK